jgi:hypothetical protein
MRLPAGDSSESGIEKAGDGVYNFYLCFDRGSMASTWDKRILNEEGR